MNIADEADALLAEINAKIKALPAYLHPYIEKEEAWAAAHPVLSALAFFGIGLLIGWIL